MIIWASTPRSPRQCRIRDRRVLRRIHRIEWLRFEPDSPVSGPGREQSHVAFHVDSLEEASRGLNCLLGPFTPLPGLDVGFYLTDDGAVVELMEYEGDPFNAG